MTDEVPFPDVEPPAELREFAKTNFDIFVALRKEGFTEHQALQIIGTLIAATIAGDDDE